MKYIVFLLMMLTIPSSCMAFDSRLEACEPYRESIEAWLEDEGVSKDFYYLAVCESGCKPEVMSHKGAVGLFQLMPWTARHYRCANPYDMECNTRAAARYIRHLQDMSPSLPTVVEMYNQGGHNRVRYGSTRESRGLSYCVCSLIDQNRSSEVVYQDGICAYWYFVDEPEKRNPCGTDEEYVPESAEIVDY